MKTLFQNASIVRVGADPNDYNEEREKRGSTSYTVRSHTLSEICRNPRRWLAGYESPESETKRWGKLFDCLALTPEQWPARYVVKPETYPAPKDHEKVKSGAIEEGSPLPWNGNAKVCQEWEKLQIGKTIVSNDLNRDVHGGLKRLAADERISELMDCCERQVWVQGFYADPTTGLKVPIKSLIDLVPDTAHPVYGTFLGDLKTTRNASPRSFARDCYKYGYHIQAALYTDLLNAATGQDRSQFLHVVVESYAPYECRMPILSDSFLQIGRATYLNALALYCRCLASGRWPGYDHEEWPVTTPEVWMTDLSTMAFPDLQDDEEAPKESDDIIP